MNPCVIVVGNAIDGLALIGPFDDGEAAHEHADEHYCSDDWIVAPLNTPCNADGTLELVGGVWSRKDG